MRITRVIARPEIDPRSPENVELSTRLTREIAEAVLPEALGTVTAKDVERFGSTELAAAMKASGVAGMVVGEAFARQGVGWPAGVSLVLQGESGLEEIVFE